MELRWPSEEELDSYVDALVRGWSPNTVDDRAGRRELDQIGADPAAFLSSQVDLDAAGDPIRLPDGSSAQRLPGSTVVPWKQRRGYATVALRQILAEVADEGLRYRIDVTFGV